jgi:hypothetical protein
MKAAWAGAAMCEFRGPRWRGCVRRRGAPLGAQAGGLEPRAKRCRRCEEPRGAPPRRAARTCSAAARLSCRRAWAAASPAQIRAAGPAPRPVRGPRKGRGGLRGGGCFFGGRTGRATNASALATPRHAKHRRRPRRNPSIHYALGPQAAGAGRACSTSALAAASCERSSCARTWRGAHAGAAAGGGGSRRSRAARRRSASSERGHGGVAALIASLKDRKTHEPPGSPVSHPTACTQPPAWRAPPRPRPGSPAEATATPAAGEASTRGRRRAARRRRIAAPRPASGRGRRAGRWLCRPRAPLRPLRPRPRSRATSSIARGARAPRRCVESRGEAAGAFGSAHCRNEKLAAGGDNRPLLALCTTTCCDIHNRDIHITIETRTQSARSLLACHARAAGPSRRCSPRAVAPNPHLSQTRQPGSARSPQRGAAQAAQRHARSVQRHLLQRARASPAQPGAHRASGKQPAERRGGGGGARAAAAERAAPRRGARPRARARGRGARARGAMSYLLPHLRTGYAVDQAILSEEDRVVVIRFGHDYEATCMQVGAGGRAGGGLVREFVCVRVCACARVRVLCACACVRVRVCVCVRVRAMLAGAADGRQGGGWQCARR